LSAARQLASETQTAQEGPESRPERGQTRCLDNASGCARWKKTTCHAL
jgi:hypothetical protein